MDIYTKVILTVIAVALSVIALGKMGVPAFAQGGIVRVELCGGEVNPKANSSVSCAQVLTDSRGIRRLIVTQ